MTELDVRSQIITAAEARFTQYGYGKTTMAEIAGDCGMSAANLYRYFNNKLDIGAALANNCLTEKERGLTLIVEADDVSSADKLQAFIIFVLHDTYHYFDERPRLNELVEKITMEHPEVMTAHSQSALVLIRRLLEKSLEKGEFDFVDIAQTAEAINTAISSFYLPSVMPLFSLAALENKARIVCNLLLTGLAKN